MHKIFIFYVVAQPALRFKKVQKELTAVRIKGVVNSSNKISKGFITEKESMPGLVSQELGTGKCIALAAYGNKTTTICLYQFTIRN